MKEGDSSGKKALVPVQEARGLQHSSAAEHGEENPSRALLFVLNQGSQTLTLTWSHPLPWQRVRRGSVGTGTPMPGKQKELQWTTRDWPSSLKASEKNKKHLHQRDWWWKVPYDEASLRTHQIDRWEEKHLGSWHAGTPMPAWSA